MKETVYFVNVRDGEYVGPHTAASLRRWVELGLIRRDWFVCKEGESVWFPVEEIQQFNRETADLLAYRKYLADKRWRGGRWWSEPITDNQKRLIVFFGIPLDTSSLNKGEASLYIDELNSLDPTRREQYDCQQCSESQADRLRELGGDSAGLTRKEARVEIQTLEEDERDRRGNEFEHEFDLITLEQRVNAQDVREVCQYGGISGADMPAFKEWLDRYHKNWKSLDDFQLGAVAKRWDRKTEKEFLASELFQRGLSPDAVQGKIKCPKCGKEAAMTLGSLAVNPKIVCAGCGVTINIDGIREHLEKLRKFDESRLMLKEKLVAQNRRSKG